MARKFLYVIAFSIVLYVGGRLALQFYPDQLSRLAFVPSETFQPQPALAGNIYDDPTMWVSHPGFGTKDPAQWAPNGAPAEPAPVRAAVFFVHPTSYLEKFHWNAALDDKPSRLMADVMVRGLASPFAPATQLWAPRYRQAAFGAFLTEEQAGTKALDAAYADVLQAFDSFVAQSDPKTPIVLAGHSQGSYHLIRLMHDRIAQRPIARRIAAAYVVGWPVSLAHDLPLMGLPACTDPAQSGCVVSWLSYAEPADPAMMIAAYARRPGLDGQSLKGSPFLCSNPLTGGVGGAAPASANLGTLVPDVLLKTGDLKLGLAAAKCRADGILSIGSPPELGPFTLPGGNYHVYDIPLFWANVRADFSRRVAAWKPAA
jgi:hypothetical protein